MSFYDIHQHSLRKQNNRLKVVDGGAHFSLVDKCRLLQLLWFIGQLQAVSANIIRFLKLDIPNFPMMAKVEML